MAKIDIISGFLGAGKTTLIKKLLNDAFEGEQVVLIENEFGEIGIDSGFLKEAGIEIREMNSGCICCSLVGDFGESLKEVIAKYHPDRILIEPSGVGKLSDVIKAVQDVADQNDEMVLNSYTTVVDAKKCKMYMRNFGEFFNNQVQFAGTIVMSRTDIVDEKKALEAMGMLRTINAEAAIVTTPIDSLDGKKLLEIMEHPVSLEQELIDAEVAANQHHHHDHEHHHDHCHCHEDHDHDHEHHHDHCHEDHDHDHEHEHEHNHEEHDHDHDHHHDHCHEDHDHDHEHEHNHEEHDHDHDHHHDHDHEEHDHEHGHEEHDHEGYDHHHHHDHDHHGHHHADEIFTSWGRETVKKYTCGELQEILDKLSGSEEYGIILRAKGMLPAQDGTWIHFDMVPEETEVRTGAPDYTGRICVIGSKLAEDKLAQLFGLYIQ